MGTRASHLFSPRVAILMYHRVYDTSVNPWGTCVGTDNFCEQMEVLRRWHTVIGLSQLGRSLAADDLPKNAVVLTFDDGYADNLRTVKPILEHMELPATFFVPTGVMAGCDEFWWDQLSRLLLEPGTLPRVLDLGQGENDVWDLGESALYTEADSRKHGNWTIYQRHDPTPRHALLRALNDRLYRMPHTEKEPILDRLFAWANVPRDRRDTHRTLTTAELTQVEDGGLVTVGAHTVSHPVLSTLSVVEQREEIERNKAQLEEILGHPVAHFAYPHGDYDEQTVACVREVGFASALTVESSAIRRGFDLHRLPRVHSENVDGDQFARRLREKFMFA